MGYELKDLRYQSAARDPRTMLDNLQGDLDLKISVGIWYFTPGGGRFHDRFVPEASIEQRIEMAADMARDGVRGIEAHFPDEVNESNAHLYRWLEQEAGVRLVAVAFSHFFDPRFEFGSLSSTDAATRDRAIEIAVGGLRLVRDLGADFAISWPGMDGYRYLHGKPFMHMWDLFEGAMAEAMDEVPGVRVAIEPKPYEPAANNIGVVNAPEAEALLYALWAIGYRGYFGIDINPENMPVQKAVALNVRALEKMKERVRRLPHERIIECHLHPRDHRGELEEILIESW